MSQTRGRLLRVAVGLFVILAVFSPLGLAHGQPTDDSLRIYAVNIVRDPPQEWTGYGIYLGNGLVIAHVVGRAARTKPSVRIAGIDLPATAIREGWFELQDLTLRNRLADLLAAYREGGFDLQDLTLLSIDEQKLPPSLRMRRMPLCDNPPWVGEPVIVAVPEGTARSRIMSPFLIQASLRARFSSLIRDVATTGNSGSGVFDATRKCLLGIMSRKIQARPLGADSEASPAISRNISCRLRSSDSSYRRSIGLESAYISGCVSIGRVRPESFPDPPTAAGRNSRWS
jgi:hypothetical protein